MSVCALDEWLGDGGDGRNWCWMVKGKLCTFARFLLVQFIIKMSEWMLNGVRVVK